MFIGGLIELVIMGPIVVCVVGSAVLWEAIDRGFDGGLIRSGKEQTGLLLGRIAPWVNKVTHNFNKQFVKREMDAFAVNCLLLLGVAIPTLFFITFWHHTNYGFSFLVFWAYHVIRIGPYFMNFAYVYTLCHKEGHSYYGFWKEKYTNPILQNCFNWWVGLFYGVMPASFAIGHSINHHKYNNGPNDVASTSDKPRDNWLCFFAYVCRWTLFAFNISAILQFMKE